MSINYQCTDEQIIIGIDPGLDGAIAVIHGVGAPAKITIYDMPVMAKKGKGRQINGQELTAILKSVVNEYVQHDINCFLEQVSARPKNGGVSMFNFGHGYGMVQGVLYTIGIPFQLVTPSKWKGYHHITRKEKDIARTLCIQQYPELASSFKRKKDVDRADALLIAAYGKNILFQSKVVANE